MNAKPSMKRCPTNGRPEVITPETDQVFDYWSHPENFPDFMTHVHEVRRIGDGLYGWSVGGPAGILVQWDAQITDLKQPQ